MLMRNYWQRLQSCFPRKAQPRKWRRSLLLEHLENRTVPTILWGSAGTRTVVDSGGPILTHVDVDLVFWGAGWNSAQTLMNNVINSVTTMVNSSYFNVLSQYRGIGSPQLLRTDLITASSPGAHTRDAQFDTFVKNNINNGNLPVTPDMDSQILYVVIPQPGTTDPIEGAAGAHYFDTSNAGRFHYAWSENINDLDDITDTLSHEIAESATDPEPTSGFHVPSTRDEIGDGEAQNYNYRLNGVLVQSLLSQADHAYTVYDGDSQVFTLSRTGVLTINGDQMPDLNDTIIVDQTNNGYKVTLNGETIQFDAHDFFTRQLTVSSIVINTGTGNDTVDIERTVPGSLTGLPVTINLGDGTDTVNLSETAQNLGNLPGAVTINGGSGADTLNLFDQGIGNNENYTITNSTIARPGMATITYHDLANVALYTSNGTDTITVQSSSAGTALAINGGSGTNTLVGSGVANTWSITGNNTGTLSSSRILGSVSFTAIQNLTGGTAQNAFAFRDGATLSGNLDGGGGGSLDYSAYSSSVIVDLQTGSATGVGGSVAHIQNVTGGSGGGTGVYNILVGNGGNVLTGGNGRRNLLIAGSSASTLQGGDDDDLLIGGTTVYDLDVASLMAIMNYWSGTSDDYATRVANILAGNGVPLLDPTTLTSNGGGNTLNGGPGLNLYFGNSTDTTDFDPNSGAVFVSV